MMCLTMVVVTNFITVLEAKYIALAIFSLGQAFLTGIPIVAVVRDMPEAYYLVLCFTIFVLCVVILALIFLPKMALQRAYAKMPASEQRKVLMQRSIRNKSILDTSHQRNSVGSVPTNGQSSEMINDSVKQLQNRVSGIHNDAAFSGLSSTKTGTASTGNQRAVHFPANSVDQSHISSLGHSFLEEPDESATMATLQSEKERSGKTTMDPTQESKSPEERFEALEKVKGYLSESEYNEKKQEILRSI